MSAKHTPGPWRFEVHPTSKQVLLVSQTSGKPFVMGFDRWGMQGAAPSFPVEGLMVPCKELMRPVRGRLHHASWYQEINHPDALLIEASPALLTACKKALAALEGTAAMLGDVGLSQPLIELLRAEIAAAEGEVTA